MQSEAGEQQAWLGRLQRLALSGRFPGPPLELGAATRLEELRLESGGTMKVRQQALAGWRLGVDTACSH